MNKIEFTVLVEDMNGNPLETHVPTNQYEMERILYAMNNYYQVIDETSMHIVTLKANGTFSDTSVERELGAFDQLYSTELSPILPGFEAMEPDIMYAEDVTPVEAISCGEESYFVDEEPDEIDPYDE